MAANGNAFILLSELAEDERGSQIQRVTAQRFEAATGRWPDPEVVPNLTGIATIAAAGNGTAFAAVRNSVSRYVCLAE